MQRKIVALKWRHMPCTAVRAVVVTGCEPFVGPRLLALVARIVIAKPRHFLLRLADRQPNHSVAGSRDGVDRR